MEKFMGFHQKKDVEGTKTCCTDDFVLAFGDDSFPPGAYYGVMEEVFASFPDFEYVIDKFYVKDGKKCLDFHVKGTHTGAPYGLAAFPKIDATGIAVENSPETLTIKQVVDGKIKVASILTRGPNGGPPGLYSQIGGKME